MIRNLLLRTALPVVLALVWMPNAAPAQAKPTPAAASKSGLSITAEQFARAAEYSRQAKGMSVLVMKDGKIIHEAYHNGHSATKVAELASGTKSFNGVMALAAVEDGILTLDEKVSDTITEWKSDPSKASITVRELLTLTSGVGGGPIGRPPTYANAVKMPIKSGTTGKFQYGPVPFQVFGELMKRKLADKKEGPLEYMERRIFKPIGLEYGSWKKGRDGNPHLPSGARLTARDWAKFGELVRNNGNWNGTQVIDAALFPELVKGTTANGNYGLTFWLKNLNPEGHSHHDRQPPPGQRWQRDDSQDRPARFLHGRGHGAAASLHYPIGRPRDRAPREGLLKVFPRRRIPETALPARRG
jgi:CubicO group peptidase (beta-lactamase class C family)